MCLVISGSIAQTHLTYKNNALRDGDVVKSYEFAYTDPGSAGTDKIWDFSKIAFTSKEQTENVGVTPGVPLPDVAKYTSVMAVDGHEYYHNITENTFELVGYTTKDIALVYTDPIVKMKYPFFYGDQFSDNFSGEALYAGSHITFEGQYNVSADATGTLILPDRTSKNALRVKVVKKSLEYNPCSTIEVHLVNYYWYVEACRYPVISLNYKTYQSSSQDVEITEKSAYFNPQESNNPNEGVAGNNELSNNDFAINTFPNPFDDKTSCTYFLRNPMDVKVELFDITGKMAALLVNNEKQQEGIHNIDIDATALELVPGVYYIKLTFDKKEIVQKIVKI